MRVRAIVVLLASTSSARPCSGLCSVKTAVDGSGVTVTAFRHRIPGPLFEATGQLTRPGTKLLSRVLGRLEQADLAERYSCEDCGTPRVVALELGGPVGSPATNSSPNDRHAIDDVWVWTEEVTKAVRVCSVTPLVRPAPGCTPG